MAITLNKFAVQFVDLAVKQGKISRDSSSTVSLYSISKDWRDLVDATNFKSLENPNWSEKEVAASRVIISALIYLRQIGCDNVELLLKDILHRDSQKV